MITEARLIKYLSSTKFYSRTIEAASKDLGIAINLVRKVAEKSRHINLFISKNKECAGLPHKKTQYLLDKELRVNPFEDDYLGHEHRLLYYDYLIYVPKTIPVYNNTF